MISRADLLKKAIKAIRANKPNLSEYLDQGLDANSLYKGKPLLYWAVKQEADTGCYSTAESIELDSDAITSNVEALYQHGADIHWQDTIGSTNASNWLDNVGNTLLHYAEEYKVAKLLLSFGVDPAIKNSKGVPGHNNDRYDGRRRMLAFFEAGVDLSYLFVTDNPALNHPVIMKDLLEHNHDKITALNLKSHEKGRIYISEQDLLDSALERALGIPRWLPSAKLLVEAGASLQKKNDELSPLETCINSIKIYGNWKDMVGHKADEYKKLDQMIHDNPYYQFAIYLYERGAFSKYKDEMYIKDTVCPKYPGDGHIRKIKVFMPPLVRIQKDCDYLPSRRAIVHLAQYEAKELNIEAKLYAETIDKIVTTATEAVPQYDYVGGSRGVCMVGHGTRYKLEEMKKLWDVIFRSVPVYQDTSAPVSSGGMFATNPQQLPPCNNDRKLAVQFNFGN